MLNRSTGEPDYLIYRQDPRGAKQERHGRGATLRLLEEGHSVTIEDGESVCPTLRIWKDALTRELGLVEPVAPPSIILSPAGSEVPPHHDGLELLVLHLRGRKRWWYGPREDSAYADYTYFPSERGPGPRGGTRPRYRQDCDPPALKESGRNATLEPGDCLFLPMGWWHQTEALADTVNVVFRLQAKPAYWVVAQAVADVLRQQPRWRRPIPGLQGDEGLQLLARRSLTELAPRLCEDLDLRDIGTASRLLRPFTGAVLRLNREGIRIHQQHQTVTLVTDRLPEETPTFSGNESGALGWILDRDRPFTESDFHAGSGLPVQQGAELLQRLIDADVLRSSDSLYFT